jgi:hypothetical protein
VVGEIRIPAEVFAGLDASMAALDELSGERQVNPNEQVLVMYLRHRTLLVRHP